MAIDEKVSSQIDRIGGSLVNAILGALILWVGQTTFRHAGMLAGFDQQLAGIKERFTEVDKHQESLKSWVEKVASQMKDSDRAHFAMKDGDKLYDQVRREEQLAVEAERRVVERLNMLDVKVAALEANHRGSQEVDTLKIEIAQLRTELARASSTAGVQYQSAERFAREAPVYLPPVDGRR